MARGGSNLQGRLDGAGSRRAGRCTGGAICKSSERSMDEEKFNMSLRKFLKQVGVTSQREIERVVREKGGGGKLKVKMRLTAEGTGLDHVVEEELDLG
jgi:hypothetical protein